MPLPFLSSHRWSRCPPRRGTPVKGLSGLLLLSRFAAAAPPITAVIVSVPELLPVATVKPDGQNDDQSDGSTESCAESPGSRGALSHADRGRRTCTHGSAERGRRDDRSGHEHQDGGQRTVPSRDPEVGNQPLPGHSVLLVTPPMTTETREPFGPPHKHWWALDQSTRERGRLTRENTDMPKLATESATASSG